MLFQSAQSPQPESNPGWKRSRFIQCVRYSARQLAAASKIFLSGTAGDIDQPNPAIGLRAAGIMTDNDSNKNRRLAEFEDGCRYGKFGKTKAYELIAHGAARAYNMSGKTMIDLDGVDENHTSLPRLETRASEAASGSIATLGPQGR